MASPIKNVAVVGGSGNLGREVVRELVAAGFSVTALTRAGSSATFPAGVTAKAVDYASEGSLTAALAGQDALVSTVATAAVAGQRPLVDAAVAAGVRRIVPSEFGINTRFLLGDRDPIAAILRGKVETLNYIHEKARQNPSFSWTGISTGLFFDWGLEYGSIGLDKATKTATIYDSGDERFQASNLRHIGRVVAAVLRQPERTLNRYISVASFNPTQNEVLALAERLTGGGEWAVTRASTEEELRAGVEKLGRGDYSAFSNLLRRRVYGDGAGLAVEGPDNALDLLGLEEEDLEASLKAWLEK
ncbi:hypothetical protein SAMD00023353_0702590 [Rosellinia necatrix]|uniref:NmrA-like domain-containing protein n=1 Tax=Rosellinia necatrix TaxID=77044 RepID=A0A1S7UMR4_ROSNE|nr:hypothetical protein SAMD00023353_0702590 [Rosellinia necatrix]